MERLQEALSRARERRQQTDRKPVVPAAAATAPTAEPAVETAAPPARSADTDAAWQRLKQFEPRERTLRGNRVLSYFGGAEAGPVDMLRTKMLHQIKKSGWRRIIVTSPTSKCGKTTMVANLAFSLSRQTELRTLVIDVDMRRPELLPLLGVKADLAFARYLLGEGPAERHMIAYGHNVAFGLNRVPVARSSELLQSDFARRQIEAIEQAYRPDIVLFDAPPVLASDDTLSFLDFTDAALIVAAAEMTSINEVDVTETEVAAATNVLGVVLNKARFTSGSSGYEDGYY